MGQLNLCDYVCVYGTYQFVFCIYNQDRTREVCLFKVTFTGSGFNVLAYRLTFQFLMKITVISSIQIQLTG